MSFKKYIPILLSSILNSTYNEHFKFDLLSVFGLITLALILFLATLGGIGGGAAMLPINLLFFRFDPHKSVAHTALFEFVSTFSRVLYEIISTRKHPGRKRINFHLIIIAAPVMFLGSFLGVNCNHISPDALVMLGMTAILVFCVIMSVKKFRKKRAEERSREKVKEGDYGSIKGGESESLAASADNSEAKSDVKLLSEDPEDSIQTNTNLGDKLFFFIICLLNPTLGLLRGTKSFKSIIDCKHCSKLDLIIVLSYLVIIIILTFINSNRMLKRSKSLKDSNKQIKITPKKLTTLLIGLFLIGFSGSYLSAGLAIMFTLTLVFLGLSPFIASPTALMLSCMTSGSATFLYLMNKEIDWLAGVLGSSVIVIFSIGTRLTLYKKMMNMGKESWIMLFIIILVSIAIPIGVGKVLPGILKVPPDSGFPLP
jgi:uncharacterized membrane protein YfcA